MQKIERKRAIEGAKVPGIIKNNQYFYTNIDVYEDGMINCWELVDLNGLKEKIASNWLIPQVPEGENISIHGLGCYKVQSANWNYDKKGYFKFINKIIKILNPKLTNIYKVSKEEKQQLEQRRIVYSPDAIDFYVLREVFYETIKGDGFTVFVKYNDLNYLANLIVYEDGRVTCYNSEFEINFKFEDIETLFNNGTFFTSFDKPTSIFLNGLGEVIFSEIIYSTDINEKYKELQDIYRRGNGEKTSLEKCRKAYHEYLENPSDETRAILKEHYELVPVHERIYLGDMDNRDTDYIRILYRPNDKREV